MNTIIKLLNLEDSDIYIFDIKIEGTKKIITLEIHPTIHFCPQCNFRIHSHGIKQRKINPSILQDTYECILILKQRRWKCTNPLCSYSFNESFNFVGKCRRNTNATEILIVNEFNVSDTYAIQIFDKYVKLDRLPLSDIIFIDEVHVDLNEYCKYALIIQNFYTGKPISLLRSRHQNITEPYFVSIPREERNQVKYLISNMYNPYIRYVDKYFPNAVPVVDSFHVLQWVTNAIDKYIRQLIKKFKQRNRELYGQHWHSEVMPDHIPASREVYLLQKYRCLILANQPNITYHSEPRMDSHFNCFMNTFDCKDALFCIDPKLQEFRDLKEMYVHFSAYNSGDPMGARLNLDDLIDKYLHNSNPIFIDFTNLLIRNREYIINSFIMVERHGESRIYNSRLSNDPIESLNRKAKDLERLGRRYRNFEHFRTRFLYATRNNPVINVSGYSNPVQYCIEDEFFLSHHNSHSKNHCACNTLIILFCQPLWKNPLKL